EDARRAVLVRRQVAHRHRAGGLRLRRAADDLDQAHAAIAGDREPLVEAKSRDLGARGLAGLEQRVLRRDVDLGAVDDELGHRAFLVCISELEPPLDAFNATVQSIEPAIDAGQSFLERSHGDLQIMQVVGHAFRALVDLPEQDQDNAFGLFCHRPYSAATRTGSGCGFAAYWSMRRSISWLKWRSRPCTGQAAPSPKAQIV